MFADLIGAHTLNIRRFHLNACLEFGCSMNGTLPRAQPFNSFITLIMYDVVGIHHVDERQSEVLVGEERK